MRSVQSASTALTFRARLGTAYGTLLLLVCGCGAAPSRDGVAVMASGADLESGNPVVTIHSLARQVQRHALFVTLARYDSALTPEAYYARRWIWSGDRRTLTMSLFAGLRWHDGVPTTAHDAAFTLDAARDPSTGSPRAGELAQLDAVAAPDDTTLVLRFATPQAALPAVLCELPLVPEHLLRDVPRGRWRGAAFSAAPVGNGPFKFASRVPGQRWVFDRNDEFPTALGGPPILQRFVVVVVDEPATKMAGLVSGDLDVAGIAPAMADLARRDPTLRVIEYPVLSSVALILNARHPALGDARVRRAISLSIDRQRIVAVAVAGMAMPASGPVPADNPFALNGVAAPVSAAAADSLLDAAGWRRGARGTRTKADQVLTLTLLTVGSGENAAEQLVQADLGARGIVVEIRQLEMGAFLGAARGRPPHFDVLYTSIPGDLSLGHLAAMYDGRLSGGALDYADFHTRALDSLFARTRTAPDRDALVRAWGAVQRELASEMPAVWIYHSRGVQGVARRLDGVRMDLRGELATVASWRTQNSTVAKQ
jgi:peptide/nickel transport system substrate-binding protein